MTELIDISTEITEMMERIESEITFLEPINDDEDDS